jgi:hypothetical protein
MSLPAQRAIDTGIRSVLGTKLEFQFYSEHLDQSLFPDPKFQAAQAAWYRNKYRNLKIDLVIAIGLVPREFLPNTPTVLCGLDPAGLPHITLSANSTAVWLSADFEGTLAAAARLQPTARQVVVVSGTSDWDRHLELAARKAFSRRETNWEINYWDDMSVEEIRSRLGKLPGGTRPQTTQQTPQARPSQGAAQMPPAQQRPAAQTRPAPTQQPSAQTRPSSAPQPASPVQQLDREATARQRGAQQTQQYQSYSRESRAGASQLGSGTGAGSGAAGGGAGGRARGRRR